MTFSVQNLRCMTLTDRMSWCVFLGETDDLLDLTPMTFFGFFYNICISIHMYAQDETILTIPKKMSDKEFPICF